MPEKNSLNIRCIEGECQQQSGKYFTLSEKFTFALVCCRRLASRCGDMKICNKLFRVDETSMKTQ